MKKLVILFLLCLPLAHAYSEYTYQGSIVQKGDYSFEILMSATSVLVSTPSDSMIIRYGNCQRFSGVEICVGTLIEDSCSYLDGKHCRVRPGTLSPEPMVRITLNEIKPQVRVTRQLSNTHLFVGEEQTVTVRIKNEGEDFVTRFSYVDDFVRQFDLVSAFGEARIEGQRIKFDVFSLRPGEERTFRYTIRPNDIVNARLVATYSYEFNNQQFSESTSAIIFDARLPIEVKYTKPSSIEVGKAFTLDIEFTSRVSRSLSMDFEITIPDSFEIVRSDSQFQSRGKSFAYSQRSFSQNRKLSFELQPIRDGTFDITGILNFTVDGRTFSNSNQVSTQVRVAAGEAQAQFENDMLLITITADDTPIRGTLRFGNMSIPIEVMANERKVFPYSIDSFTQITLSDVQIEIEEQTETISYSVPITQLATVSSGDLTQNQNIQNSSESDFQNTTQAQVNQNIVSQNREPIRANNTFIIIYAVVITLIVLSIGFALKRRSDI